LVLNAERLGAFAVPPDEGFDGLTQLSETTTGRHFTPVSTSWLNQIEIVFSLLQRHLETKRTETLNS
jgi:hypothetical protein